MLLQMHKTKKMITKKNNYKITYVRKVFQLKNIEGTK